ncbi:hypothetical protein ACTXT7_015353 [Hymenolepis weldensis]
MFLISLLLDIHSPSNLTGQLVDNPKRQLLVSQGKTHLDACDRSSHWNPETPETNTIINPTTTSDGSADSRWIQRSKVCSESSDRRRKRTLESAKLKRLDGGTTLRVPLVDAFFVMAKMAGFYLLPIFYYRIELIILKRIRAVAVIKNLKETRIESNSRLEDDILICGAGNIFPGQIKCFRGVTQIGCQNCILLNLLLEIPTFNIKLACLVMAGDDQNFVVFGEPFEEDDDENSRFLHPKSKPQAYEQRVLNERGRPMRFHGAFTGGFSAGYFNTVGSKEGFKPQSFTSSRRNRTQNAVQLQGKPEDFMDEEDFGVFGIAPRHYRTRREYDDRHIFDTLSESLGGKSVIPAANDILKRMLIPTGTSLADRLLRRMGWKSEDIVGFVAEDEAERTAVSLSPKVLTDIIPIFPTKCAGHALHVGARRERNPKISLLAVFSQALSLLLSDTRGTITERPGLMMISVKRDYAVISFAPKANTFGLGYSGLDPEIAFGRRPPTSTQDPQTESVSSLQRREQASHVGFNPSTGPIRQGIRGQAFGVGALHSEDADIYAQDSLATYDFSIAPDEEDADDEMAELEAARHGRFSDFRRKSKPNNSTLDGWTPPTRK